MSLSDIQVNTSASLSVDAATGENIITSTALSADGEVGVEISRSMPRDIHLSAADADSIVTDLAWISSRITCLCETLERVELQLQAAARDLAALERHSWQQRQEMQ